MSTKTRRAKFADVSTTPKLSEEEQEEQRQLRREMCQMEVFSLTLSQLRRIRAILEETPDGT